MTPTRILLATDFSEPAERAFQMAKSLRESLSATVHVVHVIFNPLDDPAGPEPGPRWGSDKHFEAYTLGLQAMLDDLAGKGFGEGPEVTTEILRGRPTQKILDAARETKANLICIGTTGKGMLDRILMGSVAQNLIRHSDIPVLTVH